MGLIIALIAQQMQALALLIRSEFSQVNKTLESQGKVFSKIMSDIDTANAALKRIDAATTAQGAVLTQEATTLQTISDEIDKLIAGQSGTIDPVFLTALTAQADKAEAVGKSLQAQADFSTQLAAKGAVNPVPLPVPPPSS